MTKFAIVMVLLLGTAAIDARDDWPQWKGDSFASAVSVQ